MPNTSMPMPVLRIGGANFDIDAAVPAIKINPYRTDRAGTDRTRENALYFKIPVMDITAAGLSDAIEKFLAANSEDLRQLLQISGAEYFDLDIGVIIDDQMMSRSTVLRPETMAALAGLNITCMISAYRGGEE
jgi:hypothetical protein